MIEQMNLFKVKQKFANETVKGIKQEVEKAIISNLAVASLPKGAEIAITAGSRGIANIVEILRETVTFLKEMGYNPFLVPAMGSHGGATAEGQIEVLKHLGITSQSTGAEIRSSMEVELIAYTDKGIPVYMDKNAFQADGIIVINRIKAHTAFRGRIESGLSKMVTIGLGKRKGASFVHSDGALNMADNIEEVCKSALQHSSIIMGIALVENGYDETAQIIGVKKEEWFEKEEQLLKKANKMMAKLPIEMIDLLIIEEMGKNFSGTGMDPNIIGRWRIDGVPEPKRPHINRIAILDLSEQSFGNAQGVGLADFTTEKLVKKIDRHATYTNSITSTYLRRAMLPFIYDTEKETIEAAFHSLGPGLDAERMTLIQIPNTLHLDTLLVSKSVIEEMNELKIDFSIENTYQVQFNERGELMSRISVN